MIPLTRFRRLSEQASTKDEMPVGTSFSASERHLWQFGAGLLLQKNKQGITQRALAGHFWLALHCDESSSDALKLVPTGLESRLAQWMAFQAQNVSEQNLSAESCIARKVIYRKNNVQRAATYKETSYQDRRYQAIDLIACQGSTATQQEGRRCL